MKTLQLKDVLPILWNRLGSNQLIFIFGFLSSLSQSVIMILEPFFVNLIFNQMELEEYHFLYSLLIISTGIFIFLIGLMFVGEYLKQTSMARLQVTMMVESADHAQRLPLGRATSVHSSDLVQRVTTDTTRMTGIINTIINDIGYQLAMFILAAVYLFWLNWKIAIALLLVAPLSLLFSIFLRRKLQRIGQQVADQESIIRQLQQDALQGMEVIRVYSVGEWIRDRFILERKQLNQLYVKRMWWYQGLNVLSKTFSQFCFMSTAIIVGWLAIQGTMAVGAIIALFTLVWRINSPLQVIGQLSGQIQEILGSSKRVLSLWAAEKEPTETKAENMELVCNNKLQFNEVSFSYYGEGLSESKDKKHSSKIDEQLSQITFKIPPSSFTGIVGRSGSGKSTVAKIAAGLLFATEGNVLLGGINVVENLESFRKFIAYVPQDPYLMAGTIRENLMMAYPDIENAEEAMKEAAKKAQAHEFISAMPDGYDTVIGENGKSLSGGQRQRLAIARAFLANRPLWIVDEATSALDTETEKAVMDELRKVVNRGHRLLVIAHRISTLQHADHIIVMKDGKVHEEVNGGNLLIDHKLRIEKIMKDNESIA